MSAPTDRGTITHQLIEEYVSKRKNWTPEQYYIQRDRIEEGLIIYNVIFREDERLAQSIGGGESFELHFDPDRMKIAKELYFQ